jgi:hypothetical protein
VSVLALVLTLVVISLSQGSSLPRTSLHDYLPAGVTGLGKRSSSEHADGNSSGAVVGEELSQGGREPLVEQNGQGGDANSSQTSAVTGKLDDNEPDPVASSDATAIPDESQKAEQGELLVRFPEISAQHIYQHEWFGMSYVIVL